MSEDKIKGDYRNSRKRMVTMNRKVNELFRRAELRYTKKEMANYLGVSYEMYKKISTVPLKYCTLEDMIKVCYAARLDLATGLSMIFPLKFDLKQVNRKWYEENDYAVDNYVYVPRLELKQADELIDELDRYRLLIYKLIYGRHRSSLPRDWNPFTDMEVIEKTRTGK